MRSLKLPILTSKRHAVPHFMSGGFGNKLRAWESLEAFERDGCPCGATLMYKSGRGGRGPCEYGIARELVRARVRAWVEQGRDPKLITVYETAPDDRLLINGELSDDWHFYHSRLRLPMREALCKGGTHMDGLRTRYTLQTLLTPASWEDLRALMDLYPGHIIELSVYEVLLGDLRGRNMIPWEVRDY